MTIRAEQTNENMVLHIEGRLDTITSPELEKEISELPEQVTDLTIDLKAVEYVSSAGLRVLLGAHKKMSKKGSMVVTGVCEDVMQVFEMTGFSDILVIK